MTGFCRDDSFLATKRLPMPHRLPRLTTSQLYSRSCTRGKAASLA